MKCLLCVIVLAMPGMSMAAMESAPATQPHIGVAYRAANPAPRHPLIELKFVLVRAPQDKQDLPQIDLGDQRSAIGQLSLGARNANSLRGIYVNPNMYWCAGWACMTGSY